MKSPGKRQPSLTPIRKKSSATGRKAVNYVRDIIEDTNCVFREVDSSGDYGHDAFVLLVDGEAVTSIEIALQIKGGPSFCEPTRCHFSASLAQLGFWAGHGLTTLAIVYDPDENCAWWIDLKEFSNEHKKSIGGKKVIIPKERWSRFDRYGFENVLFPMLLGFPPKLDLNTAVEWSNSENLETHDLGIKVLLTRHKEEPISWETILNQFYLRGANSSFSVIRGLIRTMGHTDEGYYNNEVPWDIRKLFQEKILSFEKRDFVELLKLVEESGFERGGVGWGLLAIIPPHPNSIQLLTTIAGDADVDEEVRYNARDLLQIHRNDPHFWGLWTPSLPYKP